MNIVIIEDEQVVADDLNASIREISNEAVNITQLASVAESITFFKETQDTDLIISDIQLGDGLSFEIFMALSINVPVIFCTAYDEYALEAFRANGIDYILKPFTTETLKLALRKYSDLKNKFASSSLIPYSALWNALNERNNATSATVLVYHQDKIIPIKTKDVAIYYLKNEVIHLLTFSGKSYFLNKNLDELEKLSGPCFFRANRQFLVNREAIVDVSSFFSRKLFLNLTLPFPEKVIVSKGKSAQFLTWLAHS